MQPERGELRGAFTAQATLNYVLRGVRSAGDELPLQPRHVLAAGLHRRAQQLPPAVERLVAGSGSYGCRRVHGTRTAHVWRVHNTCTTQAQHKRNTNTKMAHARCTCVVCVDKAACCVAHLQPFGHHVLITARAHPVLIRRGCRAPLGRYARAVAARRLQLGSLRARLAEPLGHARLGRLKRRRNRRLRTGVTAAPQPPIGPWAAQRRVPSEQRSWEPPAPGRQGQVSYRVTHKVR